MKRFILFSIFFLFLFSFWIPAHAQNDNFPHSGEQTANPTTTPVPTDIPQNNKLTEIERWGHGPLQMIRFSNDGKFFIAASSFGLAKFSIEKINEKPVWMPFAEPIGRIMDMQLSLEGNQAMIFPDRESADFLLIDLNTGEIVDQIYDDNWTQPRGNKEGGNYNLLFYSPDYSLKFSSKVIPLESETEVISQGSDEKTEEEVYDNSNDNYLFSLGMKTEYLNYRDLTEPEGCDLEFFSACGNALMPVAWSPYQASFSANNKYLGVVYSPAGFPYADMFHLFRLFDMKNGQLLYTIGGLNQPVVDFSFQPDSKQLIIGFLDGSIQLWAIDGSSIRWQTRFFSEPSKKVMISEDRKFLINVGVLGDIEVKSAINGKTLTSYKASTAALAPGHNYLALGMENGAIQVEDLNTFSTIRRMEGHTKKILSLTFSPDEKTLVSSSRDCGIRSWDLKSSKYLHSYENISIDPYEIDQKSRVFIKNIEFLPNSNNLFGFGSWGTALNWTDSSGKLNYFVRSGYLDIDPNKISSKPGFPRSFSLDPDNKKFKIDNTVYDLNTGETLGVETSKEKNYNKDTWFFCNSSGPITTDNLFQYSLGYDAQNIYICKRNTETNTIVSKSTIFLGYEDTSIHPATPFLSKDESELLIPTSDGVTFIFKVPD